MIQTLLLIAASILLLGSGFLFYHYYHFRFVSFVRNEHTPDMDPAKIEGYTDKPYYLPGDTVHFFLSSEFGNNVLRIRRMTAPYEYEDIFTLEFPKCKQRQDNDSSEFGCRWEKSLEVNLERNTKAGYYQAFLTSEDAPSEEYRITFIVGSAKKADIVLLAPVSTWNAYNPYGGKSLYQNRHEAKTVYYVSSQRPNNAFALNHDIDVEANAFNWFNHQYESVNIIPDYYLEYAKGTWSEAKIIVAVYHCEYISRLMYDNTNSFLESGGSMISLGANQYYWVIRWHEDFRRMECRKDLTFFDGSYEYGGMWKHHFRGQETLFGEKYTGSGMHTFAPFKVTDAEHWLFAGADVKNGDLFGVRGINELGISGAETDKAKRSGKPEIIAHGMNCDSEESGKNFETDDPRWNGEGGGDILLRRLSDGHAILALGSIVSASGLGTDRVFTRIIENFVQKYGGSR